VFLATVGITMILPFYWMILTSLKSPAQGALDPTAWWPAVPWQLAKTDIRNWPEFSHKLAAGAKAQTPSPAGKIWELLEEKPRQVFRDTSLKDPTPVRRGARPKPEQIVLESDKGIMRSALNAILQRPDFHDESNFAAVELSGQALRLRQQLARNAADEPDRSVEKSGQLNYFNRLVLDASFPADIAPTHRFHWENYTTVIVETHFARVLFNSVFITVVVTAGMVLTSSLAAFAFARLNFRGRDQIFLGYLATMMIPSAVTMIPVFVLVRQLGWANSYAGLIIPVMFTAYGTFMLRQFFMGVPSDLEEAALLDGCSLWGIYRHVVMPLSKPALAALTILTFMSVWRSFMWPLIVTHTRDMYTLPVALAAFREMYGVQWHLMMTGSVIMIVPMLLVFIFGQRYFIEGIRLGAVKG
jgi:multiple sugar transport system permease protein